jgi:rhodanese-related sulfurtransferase
MNISSTIDSRGRTLCLVAGALARKIRRNSMLSEAVPTATSHAPEISCDELARQLGSEHPPQLAEILGPQSFASGHLPGAINLPLEGFAAAAQRGLPDKSAEIVVYCASSTCQNSDLAARQLTSLGYRNVRVFRGGKAAWKEAGHPLVA